MTPSSSYYESVNPDLLSRIPADAKRVLEIGCGSGMLGKAYKSINMDVTYIGIELMEEPAAKAMHYIDHVIVGDMNNEIIISQLASEDKFDCIIFGDVLEHLINPTKALVRLIPFLKEDGFFLACIPNAQHWSMFVNLLHGQWPQEDSGLFDRTHLRWFTKKSIMKMMHESGLIIEEIKPRNSNVEQAKAFVMAMAPVLKSFKIKPQDFLDQTVPLQYIVRARK